MPSLGDGMRRRLELTLRLVALVAIALLIREVRRPAAAAAPTVVSGADSALLARWSVTSPGVAHLVLDSVPPRPARDWLRAMRGAGTRLSWSLRVAAPVMAAVSEPIAQPGGGARVVVASGAAAALSDAGGLIDSLGSGARGGSAELPASNGSMMLQSGSAWLRTAVRDSLVLRSVLVLGAADWESKFTIAALEEAGWQVAARLPIAPGVEVAQGSPSTPDTARFALAVVLDSVAPATVAQLSRFVRSGGGLVIGARAASIPALAALGVGTPGERVAGVARAVRSDSPREGLVAIPIARLRRDAVAIEKRGSFVTAAARRVSAGRVIQLGYEDTWRWRMLGDDQAPAAHREWWSRVASSVAYAPLVAPRTIAEIDESPYVALVASLGAAVEPPFVSSNRPGARVLSWLLFTVLAGALLGEWGSRRLRGAA